MPSTKASKKVKRVKGGKGKKDGKHESKGAKESDAETPGVNVALWELRLKATNQDLTEYRRANFNLARANEQLTNQLYSTERSSLNKTGYWWKAAEAKEDKIFMLVETFKRQEELSLEEKNKLTREINLGQDEIRMMKEREAQTEQEISDIRESKEIADVEYRENLIALEEKYLKEKIGLEREKRERYDLQIALLKLEHCEATEKLKNASQKEFDCQNEALKNIIKKDLEEFAHSVTEEKVSLAQDKEMLELAIKKNTAELKVINGNISKLMAKIASLEKALKLKAGSLEQMKRKEKMDLFTIQTSQAELDRLKKVVVMQEEEMQKVKQLVSAIVKKCKEPEKFFHEALDCVKEEIAASTLRSHPPGSDVQLTWEQKEQVLELLFTKMNGERDRKLYQDRASCTSSKMLRSVIDTNVAEEELCLATISPQAPETILPSTPNSRPDEDTT